MWGNTGKQRCKTIQIVRSIIGENLTGYPKTYSLLSAFTVGGTSYGVITETEFKQLSVSLYNTRLAAFKMYISAAEDGLDIDAVTESGYSAYRDNTTSCPIGGV